MYIYKRYLLNSLDLLSITCWFHGHNTSLAVWYSVTMVTLASNDVPVAGENESASLAVNLTQLMSKEQIIPDIIDGIGSVELQVGTDNCRIFQKYIN